MSKIISVGIIGQGRSGYDIHAASLRGMQDKFKITAVCDRIAERCNDAVKAFGSIAYTDYREMMKRKDLDLIINASTSEQHVPITLELLDAGFNVVTEKPLTNKVSDVDKLIEKVKSTGKFHATFQQARFAPYFQKVREVINSGVLGRIVMIKVAFNGFARRWDWQTIHGMCAGALLNTGPHPLDQALQLFGEGTPEVFCIMDRVNSSGNAEDHVKLILSGKGHPTIDLEVSSCCAHPHYTYQVYAANGGLTGNMTDMKWKYFKPEENPAKPLIKEPLDGRAYCVEQLKWHEGNWTVPEEQKNMMQFIGQSFYNNVYDAMLNGGSLEITLDDIRRQVEVDEKAYRQNANLF